MLFNQEKPTKILVVLEIVSGFHRYSANTHTNTHTLVSSFSRPSPEQNRLAECEEQAKAAKKGMWSEGNGSHTIRDLKYTIENPRHFVDSHHQKPVNGEAVGER